MHNNQSTAPLNPAKAARENTKNIYHQKEKVILADDYMNYYNEFGEISLTNGKNFTQFPKTPRPTIILDGIFIRKKDIEQAKKINGKNEQWNRGF